MPIIPLFVILIVCFIYKELDRWYRSNFDITIHTNLKINRETLRIYIQREREIHQKNKELDKKLQQELLGSEAENTPKKETENDVDVDNVDDDKKSQEGEDKKTKKADEKVYDERGKEIDINKEGDLPGLVLETLKGTDEETIAVNRGDQTYEKDITNQYLIDMINSFKESESKLKGG